MLPKSLPSTLLLGLDMDFNDPHGRTFSPLIGENLPLVLSLLHEEYLHTSQKSWSLGRIYPLSLLSHGLTRI